MQTMAYLDQLKNLVIDNSLCRLVPITELEKSLILDIMQAFFLTPAAEKTKTQEKNSSQKLKEKTQPLGGFSLQVRKLKKKTKISS